MATAFDNFVFGGEDYEEDEYYPPWFSKKPVEVSAPLIHPTLPFSRCLWPFRSRAASFVVSSVFFRAVGHAAPPASQDEREDGDERPAS